MVYEIALEEKFRPMRDNATVPSTMPLGHCVDTTLGTWVVFYYNPKTIYSYSDPIVPGQPFRNFFSALWNKSSKLNPRKHDLENIENDLFLQETRFAQRSLYIQSPNTPST